nr:hypothetical protein GCM10020241_05300 [Streptoalloteichus tenebrarius]
MAIRTRSREETMRFQHSTEIWSEFPELVPGVLVADGVNAEVSVRDRLPRLHRVAEERLATATEGELPEIQGPGVGRSPG